MSRKNQNSFMLKYGSSAFVDKALRTDIPHWNDLDERSKPAMYQVVGHALKNPAISNAAAAKAAAFPHEFTSSMMADYMRDHKDIHPDVLTAIAKHQGYREYIRSALADHENLPKEAWAHMAQHVTNQMQERKSMMSDDYVDPAEEHYRTERNFYLKKAQ